MQGRPLRSAYIPRHLAQASLQCTLSLALQEDKDEIINAMRSETKSLGLVDTSENCWNVFIQKVKTNLHMVFTASPVGENFRIRSQRFLATVTSTVIDW